MSIGAKVLMISSRENRGNEGGNSGARNDYGMDNAYPGFRNDGNYGVRSAYDYPRTNPGMNYGDVDNRFRDRRGREHYDNGRFAPMRGAMDDMEDNYGMEDRRGGSMEMRRGGSMEMGYGEMRGGSGGRSHYPFGPVPPVYEREPNMNRIGFAAEPHREMESNYPMDANYPRMEEMGYRAPEMTMGHAKGSDTKLTEEMAHEWMHGLHNEDGTKGPHWSMDQVKQVMSQRGIKIEPVEFWVILNAMYSDYCGVLKKHNVNNMDFYVDLAKAWLDDKDAKEGKAARYFQHIVK